MPLPCSTLLISVPNFRDLGGYPAECDRTLRHGLLYRSEDFSKLSASDMPRLKSLDIRLLCDLRSDRERLQTPNKWPVDSPCDSLNLNISVDLRASHAAIISLLSGEPTEEHARQTMLMTYRMFPSAFALRLAQLFERILTDRQLPLVFHCAAGKDRTGFIAAILLSALGVPRTTIYSDYLLTAERWKGEQSEAAIRRYLMLLCKAEPPLEVIRTLCGVSTTYLDAAFAVLEKDYGGVDSYLELIGLSTNARQRLKERLLA
jgi:protein-tyrosine phosphatase